MKISGFQKQCILYMCCVALLSVGILVGIWNVNKITDEEQNFWAGKRVEYAQYLPDVSRTDYEKVPSAFFISKRNDQEQSVKVVFAYNVKTVGEKSIVPVDVLWERESNFWTGEYKSGETGSLTFLLSDTDQEAYVTFLFDLKEYNQQKKERIIRSCLYPSLLTGILIIFILGVDLYILRTKYFLPIRTISQLSKRICNGDYSQDYLQVKEAGNDADEMTDLVCSFELMRDELCAKQDTAEKLRQSEKELISCMSHDLQTPLATIKAYTEALRDHVARSEEDRQKYLEVILKKTNTMISMIKDLLTYSNSQLGQLPMDFTEVMLQDYFPPLLEELANYAKQKGVDFIYTVDDINVFLRIDPKRMTQVLYNLVENAMKYMDKPRKQIHISIKRMDTKLHIKVEDNGMGINSEEILYIFDKFYRAEKSRTSVVPGAGLGLSICKYIMEQHEGEIWCESKQDVGSVFYLVLPLKNF